MKEGKFCSKHKRILECFCMQCDGIKTPMCPICYCEHNEKHGQNSIHISTMIDQEKNKINKCIEASPEEKKKIEEFRSKVDELTKVKEELSRGISEKLEELKNLCEKKKELSKDISEKLQASAESTLTQLSNLEAKLSKRAKVSEELGPLLEKLKEDEKYWEAYDDVTKAYSSEIVIDYAEVKKTLQECENLCEDYKKEIESIPLSSGSTDKKEIQEMQLKLAKQAEEIDIIKSIFCFF